MISGAFRGRGRTIITRVAVLIVLPGVCRVEAQCGRWLAGGGVPGVNGDVYATIQWDPDGEGSQSSLLVVGGSFTVAGHVIAQRVAAWDGTSWRALGPGITGASPVAVHALTVYDGRLIAAGRFSTAGETTSNVAVWDGASWQPLDAGITGTVHALAVWDGKLLAGGRLYMQPNSAASLAAWDDTAWTPWPLPFGNEIVRCLAVYQGQLYVGGEFSDARGAGANIHRWDGQAWSRIGYSLFDLSRVFAFAHYDGKLIVGGEFTRAGNITANSVAAWDGSSWSSLGSGMPYMANEYGVRSLLVFGPDLIAGGLFYQAGGVEVEGIAAWDGSSWRAIATGVECRPLSMAEYHGRVVVGGAVSIGQLAPSGDMTVWRPLGAGMQGETRTLTTFGGQLVAGGWFQVQGSPDVAYLAQRVADSWQPLGTSPNDSVLTSAVHDNQLYIGGRFTRVGLPASGIARWDGKSWYPLGAGLSGTARAMVSFSGALVVGGHFTNAGGLAANHIALWSGTDWKPLGGGFNDAVLALAVYNGELVAGGDFTDVEGVPARLAAWNGQAWRPLPGTMTDAYGNGSIEALAVHNGNLVIGGDFLRVNGQLATWIAQWNGAGWTGLPPGLPGPVHALQPYGRRLVAGTASGVRMLNGTSWQELGAGVNGEVRSLHAADRLLLVGGLFDTAGEHVSSSVATWEPATPNVTRQPASWTLNRGQSAAFEVELVASGLVEYQWRKDGVPVADDHRISGATGPRLVIRSLEPADAGIYDVVMVDDCGPGRSEPAQLAVTSRLAPDVDADGDVDMADLEGFLACGLSPGAPYAPACPLPIDGEGRIVVDFDRDGDLDVSDFGVLQRCLGGSTIPAIPACVE